MTKVYRKSVKGNRPNTEPGSQDARDLISKLRLTRPPYRDYCIRGLSRDVVSEDVNYVESLNVELLFLEVDPREAGDRRGTTFARTGTYLGHEDTILNPSNWCENLTVRPWVYFAHQKDPQDGIVPKNQ